ncbi:MAG: hypothetical protein Q8867_11365, partial [Bacteroidota bacterium]|nr:hypothetical protein [Bacteroidota bacterium]
DLPEYPQQKMAMLLSTISGTKTILSELEKVQKELATAGSQTESSQINTLIRKSISLTLQTKLEKAKMNSFELMSHLKSKAVKAKNKGHYNNLLQINTSINSHLANVNTALSPNLLDYQTCQLEYEASMLTVQTPYTLLMMRIVEIGLPLILSLISFLFAIHYSLTEKRCYEIKELLRERRAKKLKEEQENGKEPVVE